MELSEEIHMQTVNNCPTGKARSVICGNAGGAYSTSGLRNNCPISMSRFVMFGNVGGAYLED